MCSQYHDEIVHAAFVILVMVLDYALSRTKLVRSNSMLEIGLTLFVLICTVVGTLALLPFRKKWG